MILDGDIGGTKCNLALFRTDGGTLRPVFQRRFESNKYAEFEKVIQDFLGQAEPSLRAGQGQITAAGFGVAGAVVHQRVRATNLPWVVDAAGLGQEFQIPHVALLNDLEATGYGLEVLRPDELCTLNPGIPAPQANRALIAAGTGLGEAILFWDGGRHIVAATEGGHCDFAARNDTEIELLRFLKKRHEFADCELILSGRGFRTLHEFLNPSVKHSSFETPGADPAPEITKMGLASTCKVCVKTLDLFAEVYGAEAGNLALKCLARGGVYVAGGIAVKILEKLKDGSFVRAFCAKANFGILLSQIPIYVVLNTDVPLLGAAARAAALGGT